MSIINFTPADALQTLMVEPGIYTCEIVEIDGPKPSASKKSIHYFVTFRITEGKYKGKEKTVAFNTETLSTSVLGSMQFTPHSSLLLIDAAINNKKVEAIDYALDTDDLMEKPLDVQWGVVTVEGILINTLINFYTAGYGATAPGF